MLDIANSLNVHAYMRKNIRYIHAIANSLNVHAYMRNNIRYIHAIANSLNVAPSLMSPLL